MPEKTWPQAIRHFDNEGARNRIVHIHGGDGPVLVFIPGWLSTMYTWKYFLPIISRGFRVHYFESREKPGTQYCTNLPDQSYAAHTTDVATYLNAIAGDYVVIASSIGATTYLNALPHVRRHPVCQVLISPNLKAPTPTINWLLTPLYSVLLKLPVVTLRVLRPPVLFLVERTSYKNDAHQIAGMVRAIADANLPLATESARRIGQFLLDPATLSTLAIRTLIVAARRDDVHNSDDAIQIADALRNSESLVCESFSETHGSKCARAVHEWLVAHL